MIAGSTPATVWAPALPFIASLVIAVALVALASPRLRPAALALWLPARAVLTHRVVDDGPGGVRKRLAWHANDPIRTYAATDPSPRDCHLALVPALCVTRGGHARRIATVLPFRSPP